MNVKKLKIFIIMMGAAIICLNPEITNSQSKPETPRPGWVHAGSRPTLSQPPLAKAISAGRHSACLISANPDGDVYCWGNNESNFFGCELRKVEALVTPNKIQGLENVSSIDTFGDHLCAVTNDQLVCSGRDNYFNLGINNCSPTQLNTADDIKYFESGVRHACALKNDGKVYCWGSDHYSQIGNGLDINTEVSFTSATEAVGLSDVSSLSVGANHTCAITESGTLYCWGNNSYGQIGNGEHNEADRPVSVMKKVAKVSAGELHTCALTVDGKVFCWGYNETGALGDGTTENRNRPVEVAELRDIIDISSGLTTTCAINRMGKVFCWGQRMNGDLNGERTTAPIEIQGLPKVFGISLGQDFACVITNNRAGKVYCWGNNSNGQLGNGTTIDSETPMEVVLGPSIH